MPKVPTLREDQKSYRPSGGLKRQKIFVTTELMNSMKDMLLSCLAESAPS